MQSRSVRPDPSALEVAHGLMEEPVGALGGRAQTSLKKLIP